MRKLLRTTLALLALSASGLLAQGSNPWANEAEGRSISRADLPPCSATSRAGERRAAFTVRDCASAGACSTTGNYAVRLVCDNGAGTGWAWRAVNFAAVDIDLSAYAPLTAVGARTLSATGDEGSFTLTAGTVTLLMDEGDGEPFFSLRAGVDPSTSPGFSADASVGAAYVRAPTTFPINVAGGVAELVANDKEVIVGALVKFQLTPTGSPPITCDAGAEGAEYADSNSHLKCYCNGTAWVQEDDYTTTTGCAAPE